jgi:hypothetical protein
LAFGVWCLVFEFVFGVGEFTACRKQHMLPWVCGEYCVQHLCSTCAATNILHDAVQQGIQFRMLYFQRCSNPSFHTPHVFPDPTSIHMCTHSRPHARRVPFTFSNPSCTEHTHTRTCTWDRTNARTKLPVVFIPLALLSQSTAAWMVK